MFSKLKLPLAFAILCAATSGVFAHGGGLNADGCHNNRKTGDYHCHGGGRSSAPAPSIYDVPQTATPRSSSQSGGFTCGYKTTCGEMSSCAEAYYYLNTCGLGRLDRDNDGMPCESICR